MPVQRCRAKGRPGWKFGKTGHCYVYRPGDQAGSNRAKKKALKQGLAIGKGTLK